MIASADVERIQVKLKALPALDAIRRILPYLHRTQACQGDNADSWALRFAGDWLAKPDEDRRMAALQEAERLNFAGVAGLLYAAIGWTRGSMVDPKVSEVPVPDGLSARAGVGAVLTAMAAETDMERRQTLADELLAELG
jgi:hypothetical protein